MKKIFLLPILLLILLSSSSRAQISVVNIQLMPYNITPEALLAVSINNAGNAQQIHVISRLYNFNNELLVTVKSAPFGIKQGLNSPYDGSRKVASSEYFNNNQSEYIKTTHGLPSGAFKVCASVIYTNSSEIADEFCDEIESSFNQYLYLVYPADKEIIETTTPLLSWTHSEPFSVLTQGEYYRMIVTEIKEKQSPEEAIAVNVPLMMKNYLTTHSLQYPIEAKVLVPGNHYAWQVQKLSNGIITNKTEAWEFSIATPATFAKSYIGLRKVLDASFYQIDDNILRFKFTEEYSGKFSCTIHDAKGKPVSAKAKKEDQKTSPLYQQFGYNQFEINLNEYEINSGFHTLEVKTDKNEVFLLKFFVP